MLTGGPRSAVEEIYLMQVEEATNLRTDMREVVDVLRAGHALYQEIAEQRRMADRQILESVTALTSVSTALVAVAHQANAIPDRVQTVLNSAEVTQFYKKLVEALELDIWARLGSHSENEARRLAHLAARVEKSVHAAVKELRDANSGKPSLPPANTDGTARDRLLSLVHHCYIRLVRLSVDIRHLAVTFAAGCVGLAALGVVVGQIARLHVAQ